MARCPQPEWRLLPVLLCAALAVGAANVAPDRLGFERHGEPVAALSLAALKEAYPVETVRVFEPYEERELAFLAFDFTRVLDGVYGESWRGEEELLFTCSDGYQPTLPTGRLKEHRAWLAFDRADGEGFTLSKLESGVRVEIELGPFYLIWENLEDEPMRREGDYGWPYKLVGVDLIRPRERFPRMAPPEGASEQAIAGFREFRIHCSRCHSINGEGGTLGADLNQPTNPVEFRDRDWLRRWIEDPSRILPTARMPRLNPALADRERVVDEILAYLQAMSRAKRSAPHGG